MPYLLGGGQAIGRITSHRFLTATLIQVVCVGILAGLGLAHFGVTAPVWTALALLPFIVRVRRKDALALLILLGLSLLSGVWRGQIVANDFKKHEVLLDQEVVIDGRVMDDSSYTDNGQREFYINNAQLADQEVDLPGRIRIRTFQAGTIYRGDEVRVTGTLREGFGTRAASIYYAEVEVQARSGSPVESLRRNFFAGANNAVPEPESSLGLGFLVGTRTLLPEMLIAQLSATGLTHIVAVSGYNLTILVRLTRRLFSKISKYFATASSVALMALFVSITGFSASISRAVVVSLLALAAWYYGRKISPWMLLWFSGALTAFINPIFLWYDLGWWLSFLAFIGVLIVAPLITKRLYKGDKKPNTPMQIAIETSSAQLMTMPLIGYIFGEFSLIALPANVIVLPLIPLAMLLTFFAGLSGMIFPALAGWFGWPATILLSLITELVNFFAKAPSALLAVDFNLLEITAIYAGIVAFIVILYLKLYSRDKFTLNGAEVVE